MSTVTSITAITRTTRITHDECGEQADGPSLPSNICAGDLEGAADTLLADAGFLGREHGIYTGGQLARKMRIKEEQWPVPGEHGVSEETLDYLVELRLNELIELARLTAMQEICFRLRVGGLAERDLAATLGISRHRAAVHLRIAGKRVRAVYAEGPYAGWYEVYLSEVKRGKRK